MTRSRPARSAAASALLTLCLLCSRAGAEGEQAGAATTNLGALKATAQAWRSTHQRPSGAWAQLDALSAGDLANLHAWELMALAELDLARLCGRLDLLHQRAAPCILLEVVQHRHHRFAVTDQHDLAQDPEVLRLDPKALAAPLFQEELRALARRERLGLQPTASPGFSAGVFGWLKQLIRTDTGRALVERIDRQLEEAEVALVIRPGLTAQQQLAPFGLPEVRDDLAPAEVLRALRRDRLELQGRFSLGYLPASTRAPASAAGRWGAPDPVAPEGEPSPVRFAEAWSRGTPGAALVSLDPHLLQQESLVYCTHRQRRLPGAPACCGGQGQLARGAPWTLLAHELVHASHALAGESAEQVPLDWRGRPEVDEGWSNSEELRAVAGSIAGDALVDLINENALHADLGEEPRICRGNEPLWRNPLAEQDRERYAGRLQERLARLRAVLLQKALLVREALGKKTRPAQLQGLRALLSIDDPETLWETLALLDDQALPGALEPTGRGDLLASLERLLDPGSELAAELAASTEKPDQALIAELRRSHGVTEACEAVEARLARLRDWLAEPPEPPAAVGRLPLP